jgi:hypothetical protein
MKTAAIVSNRNDGYKEKERFIIHLTTLLDTFDEVIYIDWNSPVTSAIYDIIDYLPKTGRLKHFIISPEVHNLFASSIPDLPNCFDSLALNIGLRRSDADWVVITTSDIIPPFKKELESFLFSADKDTFYTLSRRDIEYNEVLVNTQRLTEFRKELALITSPRRFFAKVTPNDEYSIINCCGDFQLAHRNIWFKVKGLEENMCYKCFVDTNVQKKAILNGFKLEAIFDIPLYHMSHDNILPQSHTSKIHKTADKKPVRYNDAWEWVELFTESKNDDNWGLANVDIEYETI